MVRERLGAVGRWAVRGCGARLSAAGYVVSQFPPPGFTHRSPGFRARAWQYCRSGGNSAGLVPRSGVAGTRREEAASRFLLLQRAAAGLWALRASGKKHLALVRRVLSHVDSLGSENSLREVQLLTPFYRGVGI